MNRFVTAVLTAAAIAVAVPVHGSSSIYMAPEHVAARAPLAVEARVERVAAGFDPAGGTIATYVTLRVDAVHRGRLAAATVVLREAGGRVGDTFVTVDAAPIYRKGERVFAFLEPGADGALRTAGMFFGKFSIEQAGRVRRAVRDLTGEIRRDGRPLEARAETFAVGDLIATAAGVPLPRTGAARSEPPELERLWFAPQGRVGADPVVSAFVAADTLRPARWPQPDQGVPVLFELSPKDNPLGSDAAAIAAVRRAMDAWTAVPESRVTLALSDTESRWTEQHDRSPASGLTANGGVILFDDPYDDISDPVGCTGVLAIGGYWGLASSYGGTVNNVSYAASSQAYVIFNNDYECFLGEPDNLAEIAAHELGHTLGFGHSTAPGSIMRAYPYGARGPRLVDDDRDAAHCVYPHRFRIEQPVGGEIYRPGSRQTIRWTSTEEAGPDAGTVDLELTLDGGHSWLPIARDVANDGEHPWTVPEVQGRASLRLIRYNRVRPSPAPFPVACTSLMADTIRIGRSDSTGAIPRERPDERRPLRWIRIRPH